MTHLDTSYTSYGQKKGSLWSATTTEVECLLAYEENFLVVDLDVPLFVVNMVAKEKFLAHNRQCCYGVGLFQNCGKCFIIICHS